jgi:hypothetical protein
MAADGAGAGGGEEGLVGDLDLGPVGACISLFSWLAWWCYGLGSQTFNSTHF